MYLIFVFIIILCIETSAYNAVIETLSGPLVGKVMQYGGMKYNAYLGIPYAESPLGDLRFMPPVTKKPWTGVLIATREGAVCPQHDSYHTRNEMNEDCLFINVYVPAEVKERMAVYAFIHGGGFKGNSGSAKNAGPEFLLEKGLIVVTMNYRQGALGFLCFGIDEASGNAGLKDIILSLKWIKENINRFGGDDNRITLGSDSSSASIIHMLMMTNKTTGIFNRAIIQSGSVLNKRYVSQDPIKMANALAQELRFEGDSNEIINRLKRIDAFKIVEAQEKILQNSSYKLAIFTPFAPCIEKNFTHAVLTKPVLEATKTGMLQNVTLMMGYNAQEGLTILRTKNYTGIFNDMKKNPELLLPLDIEYPVGSNESKALAKSISKFFFGDELLSNWTIKNIVDLHTDIIYLNPINSWIELYKERPDCGVLYRYFFDFDGDLNWIKLRSNITAPGTSHGDDIGYIFRTTATEKRLRKADMRSRGMVYVMTTLFSNFIKYGNPTPDDSDIIWPETDKNGRHIIISDHLKIDNNSPYLERNTFWQVIYKKYQDYVDNGGVTQSKSYV